MPRMEFKAGRWLTLAAVLLFAAVLMLYGLDGTPHRGRYDDVDRALVARTMADTGDWLVPRLRTRALLTKPPLMYWVTAGLVKLTGRRDELPGDLTSVFSMLMVVGCTWGLGVMLFDRRTALRAGLILATMYSFLDMSRHTLMDTVLTAVMMLAAVAMVRLVRDRDPDRGRASPVWWLMTTAALAMVIMAKGPVGLPVLVLIAVPLFWRAGVRWPRWPLVLFMVILSAAIVLPWFVAVMERVPEAREVWRTELLGRMGRDELTGTWPTHPFWFYIPQLSGTVPWLLLLAAATRLAWRRRRERTWRVLLWWAVGGFLFFSFASSSKRSFYLLPLYPAMALMTAGAWTAWFGPESRADRFTRTMARLTAWFVAGAAVVFGGLPFVFPGVPRTPFLLAGIAGLAAGVIAVRGLYSADFDRFFGGVVAAAAVMYLAWFGHLVPLENAFRSGKPFLAEAARRLEPAGVVLCEMPVPLTLFYLDSPRYLNEPRDRVLPRLEEDPRRMLVTTPEVAAALGAVRPVLVDTLESPFGTLRALGLYRLDAMPDSIPASP